MIRDPTQIKNSNIWQKASKSFENTQAGNTRTIIVMGDQKAGKTSFIKIIKGDIELDAKPTRLIDYFTMKKSGYELEFYQISSPKFISILQFLIKPQTAPYITIVLCVDLTQTQNFVSRVNQKIQTLRKDLKNIVQKKQIDKNNKYNEQRSKVYKYIESNDDNQVIKRMPFKFIIAGCKYDLYQRMLKVEEKKWISRCLRYLAHVNQASLMFATSKNMQNCAELRQVFGEDILGMRTKSYSNKDFNKPIYVFNGEDKIAEMNLPAFNNSGAFNEMKILEQQLESVFPSKKHIEIKEDGNKFNDKKFASIGLDSIISKYRKEVNAMIAAKNSIGTKKKIENEQQNFYGTGMNGVTGKNFNTTTNYNKTNEFNNETDKKKATNAQKPRPRVVQNPASKQRPSQFQKPLPLKQNDFSNKSRPRPQNNQQQQATSQHEQSQEQFNNSKPSKPSNNAPKKVQTQTFMDNQQQEQDYQQDD